MGNLQDILLQNTLEWRLKMQIGKEIAQGMSFLHR